MRAVRSARSGLGVALLAALSIAGTSGSAGAGSPTGAHRLLDSQGQPGATCVYDGADVDSALVSIKVRPPLLYAQNRRPGKVDKQTVGWRYVVESSPDDFEWTQVIEGPIVTATASDKTKATFAWQTWKAAAVDYHMRVRIDAYWYRNGEVVASVRMTPLWYAYQPFGYTFGGSCAD